MRGHFMTSCSTQFQLLRVLNSEQGMVLKVQRNETESNHSERVYLKRFFFIAVGILLSNLVNCLNLKKGFQISCPKSVELNCRYQRTEHI